MDAGTLAGRSLHRGAVTVPEVGIVGLEELDLMRGVVVLELDVEPITVLLDPARGVEGVRPPSGEVATRLLEVQEEEVGHRDHPTATTKPMRPRMAVIVNVATNDSW